MMCLLEHSYDTSVARWVTFSDRFLEREEEEEVQNAASCVRYTFNLLGIGCMSRDRKHGSYEENDFVINLFMFCSLRLSIK